MVQETVEGNSLEMELRQDQVEGWLMNSSALYTLNTIVRKMNTVGFIKNETLVFVNFSAQDASILKITVPTSKRRS